MKKDKTKTTNRVKKRIYVRHDDQDRLSSRNSQSEVKKLKVSEVDIYHYTANNILRKMFRDRVPLTLDERSRLNHIVGIFDGLECYKDENICKPNTCGFACIPEEWVKYEGFEFLCDLVYNYIENGHTLVPPEGGDAMGCRMPGDGFCNH